MDSAECADLFSFIDQITDWDNFQPGVKSPVFESSRERNSPCTYIRRYKEQPPLPRCQKDDKENISPVK